MGAKPGLSAGDFCLLSALSVGVLSAFLSSVGLLSACLLSADAGLEASALGLTSEAGAAEASVPSGEPEGADEDVSEGCPGVVAAELGTEIGPLFGLGGSFVMGCPQPQHALNKPRQSAAFFANLNLSSFIKDFFRCFSE